MLLSRLGLLNFCVLQWFTVRLVRVDVDGCIVGYKLLYGVVPFSGWKTKYVKTPFFGISERIF